MAPRRYPIQSDVLYNSFWTEYVDLCFVMKLEQESTRLGHPLHRRSFISLKRARKEVNLEFATIFSEEYCLRRFLKLEERFRTFSEIITMPEVIYNAETNIIDAEMDVWDKICMAKELGVAYRYQGDPCWEYLQRIFGEPVQYDLPNRNAVINISSDNSEGQPRIPGRYGSNQIAVSATVGGYNLRRYGASSTGRTGVNVGRPGFQSSTSVGGDENRSSQASNSFQEATRQI